MFSQVSWRLIRSLILSFFLSVLLLFGLTFLLYKFRLSEPQITFGICTVYSLSCLAGGLLAGKAMKSRRFLWGFLTGVLYFLVLLTVSALQDQGVAAEQSQIVKILAVCAGSGMLGGIIS